MSKKIYISIFISVLCGVVLLWAVFKCYEESKRALTIGTVSALYSAIICEIDKSSLPVLSVFYGNNTTEPQTLNSKKYDRLINILLQKNYNLDAPKYWDRSKPLCDVWGNRFIILYESNEAEKIKITVLSKGTDGLINTKDDIKQ